MSVLEFIASLAWPVTVLAIALLFRKQIDDMLSGRLTRFKAGPFEANWERTIVEVESDLGETATPELAAPGVGLVAELASLAERSPATAVLEAYARLEKALRHLVDNPPVDVHLDSSLFGAPALAQTAHRGGRIRHETVQAVEGVSVLRNLVAHGHAGEVTIERAKDYLALVDAVLFAVRMDQQRTGAPVPDS